MAELKNRKSKNFFYLFLMFIITFSICLGFMEIFSKYYYTDANYIANKEFDPQLGWIYIEGTYSIKPPHSFKKHLIHINKYGIRNRVISNPMKSDVRRIIVLGDSFTFASAIDGEDIFTSKLEKILNQNSNEKYEVINAGVEGYGTVQELLLMRRLRDNNITGEIYILMVFLNDILDNLCLDYGNLTENYAQPMFEVGSHNKLELKRAPQKKIDNLSSFKSVENKKFKLKFIETIKIKIESFLQNKPNLINFIAENLGISVKFPRVPGVINGWYHQNILERGMPILKESIKEIRDEARELHAKLYIILIPSPIQIYSETYRTLLKNTFPNDKIVEKWDEDKLVPQKFMKEISKEYNIPLLDLYPILLRENKSILYIPLEGHFNRKGHAIVADSIAKSLQLSNY